jgi:hypothetical protein
MEGKLPRNITSCKKKPTTLPGHHNLEWDDIVFTRLTSLYKCRFSRLLQQLCKVAKEGHTYLASTYIFLPQYTVKFFAQPCFSFHLPQLLFFSLQPTSLPPSDDTHFAGAVIILATLFVCGTSFAISTTMKGIRLSQTKIRDISVRSDRLSWNLLPRRLPSAAHANSV